MVLFVVKKFMLGRKFLIVCYMSMLKKFMKFIRDVSVKVMKLVVKVKFVRVVGLLVKKVKKCDV